MSVRLISRCVKRLQGAATYAAAGLCATVLSQAGYATITHALVPSAPAGLPPGVQAFDLQVTVSAGDDWTATQVTGTALSGAFVDPNPASTFNGTNAADLWFASTAAAPNPPVGAATTSFALGPTITPASVTAVWFDVVNAGSGTFTVARFLATSGAVFTMVGDSTTQQVPTFTHYALQFQRQALQPC